MLSSETIDSIAHCIQQSQGQEVCGFLLCDNAGKQRFYRVKNLSGEPHSFFVSQLDFDRLRRHAQRRYLQIKALIHTHDSGLELSSVDRAYSNEGEIMWIVVTNQK